MGGDERLGPAEERVPKELRDQFAPGVEDVLVKQWANHFTAEFMAQAERVTKDGEDYVSAEHVDQYVRAKCLAIRNSPDTDAWIHVAALLCEALGSPAIQRSREVQEFVSILLQLSIEAPLFGGTSSIFKRIRKAASAKASSKARVSGEDTRERVFEAWQSDVALGEAERGRAARVGRALNVPESTVRGAVASLTRSGRLAPKTAKNRG